MFLNRRTTIGRRNVRIESQSGTLQHRRAPPGGKNNEKSQFDARKAETREQFYFIRHQ